jgi:hypothetical protein
LTEVIFALLELKLVHRKLFIKCDNNFNSYVIFYNDARIFLLIW